MRPRNGPGGPQPYGPDHKMSWAFGPDVAAAVLAVARAGRVVHGVVLHIACEEHVTIWEMAALIARAVHGDPARVQMDFMRVAQMPQHDVGPIR